MEQVRPQRTSMFRLREPTNHIVLRSEMNLLVQDTSFDSVHSPKRTGALTHCTSVQILGFEWKNCGKPDAPAVLKTLSVAPDPISIPGDLTAAASGSTTVELASPLAVSSHMTPQSAGGRGRLLMLSLVSSAERDRGEGGGWVLGEGSVSGGAGEL